MRATRKEYEAVCEVIDAVKLDDRQEDTDIYAERILDALGLDCPHPVSYGDILGKD